MEVSRANPYNGGVGEDYRRRYNLGLWPLEMFLSTTEATMGRPRGRPKTSERNDVSTKFDKALLGMARMVATAKGISLAEYISEAARPVIEKDFGREMKRLGGEG